MFDNAINPARILVPWGDEKYSDKAISDMVFYGFGQHRIVPVRKGDQYAPTTAKYGVYTAAMATLEHKEGFGKLGADAYFDESRKLVAIQRGGKVLTPSSSLPFEPKEWKIAKMVFRGSLHGAVTLADHLFLLHLVVANALVRATTETLQANDPMRRFLTPFTFRTSAINFAAAKVLIPEQGQVHRGAPFTKPALQALFKAAEGYYQERGWSLPIPEQFKRQGVNVTLPLHQDGLDYHEILHELVSKYVDLHLPSNDCSSMKEWYERLDAIAIGSLVRPFNCENLKNTMSTFLFMVTAFHTHAGALMSEAVDPCFCPWSFREGELCGLPRPTLTQLLIYISTSREQPKIYEDFSHMFEDQDSKSLWTQFTKKVIKFQDTVDERNKERAKVARIYRGVDPRVMEVSVGI